MFGRKKKEEKELRYNVRLYLYQAKGEYEDEHVWDMNSLDEANDLFFVIRKQVETFWDSTDRHFIIEMQGEEPSFNLITLPNSVSKDEVSIEITVNDKE